MLGHCQACSFSGAALLPGFRPSPGCGGLAKAGGSWWQCDQHCTALTGHGISPAVHMLAGTGKAATEALQGHVDAQLVPCRCSWLSRRRPRAQQT